jgi:hypothetical protein
MDEIDALEQRDEPALFRAVLMQCWQDATCPSPSAVGGGGRTSFEERDEARRWLLSPLDPWREDRELVCTFAGYSADKLVRAARAVLGQITRREAEADATVVESDRERAEREALADHLELGGSPNARGWLRKKARAKPAAPQWDSHRLFDFLAQHEKVLAAAEVEQGLVECQRRADLERMASRRENARANRYIETAISSVAAEYR